MSFSHRTQWFHQNAFGMLSDILAFWWDGMRMCGSVNEKFWKLGFISVLSSTVNAFWRGASVNGNACTLPGSRPDVLGCGPPVSGSKPAPPPHRFKEWKYYWSCGLWLSLSPGRNLVVIGKVFKHQICSWRQVIKYLQSYVVCKKTMLDINLMYLFKVSSFFLFCAPFMGLRKWSPVSILYKVKMPLM